MSAAIVARFVLWLWFGTAVAVGYFRVLARMPAPAVQAIIFGLTGVLVLAYFKIPAVRAWVNGLDVRTLVAVHLTRFVGIYFLVLHQRGELPRAFAVPAGIGDIVVATFAVPVIFAPLDYPTRLRAIVIWNVVGLVDILMVVGTAARINLRTPGELRALTLLPLSLLPTFLVPLIIATHIVLFARALQPMRK